MDEKQIRIGDEVLLRCKVVGIFIDETREGFQEGSVGVKLRTVSAFNSGKMSYDRDSVYALPKDIIGLPQDFL